MLNRLYYEVFAPKGWKLSPSLITEKNWCSVVVCAIPDYIQCEWLSEAITSMKLGSVIYLSHGGDLLDGRSLDKGESDAYSISNKIFHFNTRCLVLTNENLDFVLFVADDNSYYILAGSKEFMKVSYKASFHAAKIMYFSDIEFEREISKEYYKKIWETYAAGYD